MKEVEELERMACRTFLEKHVMVGYDVWHSEVVGLFGEAGEVVVTKYRSCRGGRHCRGAQWKIVSLEEIVGAG